jgi:hypothetical protein
MNNANGEAIVDQIYNKVLKTGVIDEVITIK